MIIPSPGFDALTLAAVAAELRAALAGAKVQKVQQPSANDVILACYGRAGAQRILFCVDPKRFRAHLTGTRRENPVTPPLFCQICRKYLEGARVEEVTLPQLDRVLHIVFLTHDGERVRLVAELMGRNANLVLVSGAGVVRATVRPTPAESERPLRPGAAYAEPPGYHDRVDPLALTSATDPIFAECPPELDAAREWLAATFAGIGKFAAAEIVARAESAGGVPAALVALMEATRKGQFEPFSIADTDGHTVGVWPFEPLTVPAGLRHPRESISVALETFYSTLADRTEDADERKLLNRALAREIAYRKNQLTSAKATLAESDRAVRYEELGNNLLAALYRVERGMASVTLPDLYAGNGGDIEITLDPKKSPQENAESYFGRARKARDAAEYATGHAADMAHELALLTDLQARLDAATAPETLAALRAELTELAGADRVQAATAVGESRPKLKTPVKPFGGFRIRSYTVEGFTLMLGETAEANDYLTTRIASPTDLWFHARGVPGPHGVLKTGGQPGRVPQGVILRCAEIVAARTGSEKHSRLVPVDVTEKRYVRKPRGAKPGLVTLQRERTLDVTPRL